MAKKIIAFLLVVSLTAAVAIGGTLAYFTDRDSEANVFTVGDVKIDLEEEFEPGAQLVPGVNIKKKPTITNTGINDAWVWMEFAIPSALDNAVQGTEEGSNENVIHWNPLGATTEGYVNDTRVANAIAAGHLPADITAAKIIEDKATWNVFNSLGEGKNMYQREIDGVEYNVYVLLYNKPLAPNETTLPGVYNVFMDAEVDIDPNGDWHKVSNGVVTDIDWNSTTNGNPVIYVSAYAIQAEGFGTVEKAYAAYQTQWDTNGGEYAPIPALVHNAQELDEALTAGKKAIFANDITVDEAMTWAEVANIDMNGYTLFSNGLNFQAGGKIENGTIKSVSNTNMVEHLMISGGVLEMNDVTVNVQHTLNANANWTEAVGLSIANATAVLNNCDILVDNQTAARWVYSYGIGLENSTLTVNGGSIVAKCVAGTDANGPTNPNAIASVGAATVNMNGVDVTAMYQATTVAGHLTFNTTDRNVTSGDIVDNKGGSHTVNYL